ncbi:MAG: CPBP family intramembrane metalloprotease [Anaerolineae bacterium]|nr:CPBP family intramembrane metalloprotease [Anaerolineae bacterium]
MAFLQFVPFILIVIAANLGEERRGWRIATYLLLLGLDALFLFAALIAALLALAARQGLLVSEEGMISFLGSDPNWAATALSLAALGIAAAIVLLPPVRRAIARVLPINPASVVHATALAGAVYFTASTVLPLALFGDLSNLGDLQGVAIGHAEAWQQTLALALLALFGVGTWVRRQGKAALERLALRWPTPSQVAAAAGVVLGLLVFDYLWSIGWYALDPAGYARVGNISKQLLGGLFNPLGAVTLGLSAGIGEETLFRGALLPRFGLVFSSLLFMVVHVQYAFSPALVEVFIIGLVLGLVRQRANTTTCILVHATYNFLGVMLAPLYP